MKGTIVKCMEEMVTQKFGPQKWKQSLRKAGFSEERDFTLLSDVEDSKFHGIVKGVADAVSLSLDQVM